MEPNSPILPYETPGLNSVRTSWYGLASLCVGILSAFWFFLDTPIDPAKHDRIGAIVAILGIILAMAAYKQPHRKRMITHFGMAMSAIALLAYIVFQTP
jgi:hypothetical protein